LGGQVDRQALVAGQGSGVADPAVVDVDAQAVRVSGAAGGERVEALRLGLRRQQSAGRHVHRPGVQILEVRDHGAGRPAPAGVEVRGVRLGAGRRLVGVSVGVGPGELGGLGQEGVVQAARPGDHVADDISQRLVGELLDDQPEQHGVGVGVVEPRPGREPVLVREREGEQVPGLELVVWVGLEQVLETSSALYGNRPLRISAS
jgi:hypothetical protein